MKTRPSRLFLQVRLAALTGLTGAPSIAACWQLRPRPRVRDD